MQLKTIEELKLVCKAMPHLVGGLLLWTLAVESTIHYKIPEALIFIFSGFMLTLSGMGTMLLDVLVSDMKK